MTTESISKQQKLEEKKGIDWISTLPDSILLHILSFLPTKTSVATMPLVSRRWRYLWKDLQVFDFYNEAYEETDAQRFAIFVNAVLNLRRYPDIRRLRYSEYDRSFEFICPASVNTVNMCIRDAMGPCLEELHLHIEGANILGIVDIPSTLFDCINLVSLSSLYVLHTSASLSLSPPRRSLSPPRRSLSPPACSSLSPPACSSLSFSLRRLKGGIDLNVLHFSGRIYFPSLKNMCLHISSLDSIDALLTGCPILETLDIIHSSEAYSVRFRVPPSLKRLTYSDYSSYVSTYIDIDAPCLEYLSITSYGTLELDTAVENLQNVVEAYIAVEPLLNLLRAISRTKYLTLCPPSTEQLLLCAPTPDFPEFRYLLRLDLTLPYFNSNLLANVLQNCHVLQDFVIDHNKKAKPRQIWEPRSSRIPNCLVSHLTSIHIKEYLGLEDELTFVEYILRNALVLKTMIIKSDSSTSLKEKHCILKKISNIPRGSNLCQVEFE